MDPQYPAIRDDIYHIQMDIKHVLNIQNSHADRLLRLEKRQADDAALKSVWNTPFPSVLSGTPQQAPTRDEFDDFDGESGQNILGSLQLDPDEEPVRRGASRANSVRFDVSTIQGGGNWAHQGGGGGSRSSGDFGPIRPSSGFGSHPMTERSFSHKSDGRHSSAGHSVHSLHSGRTSSLGLDANFTIGGGGGGGDDDEDHHHHSLHDNSSEPPANLFLLGPVPSIIRCWLGADFSHNSLLYAVVCPGSYKSLLDYALVRELGLVDEMQKTAGAGGNGGNSGTAVGVGATEYTIELPVYLPEAIVTRPTSRPNSPAPQLPTMTANFEVFGVPSPQQQQRGATLSSSSSSLSPSATGEKRKAGIQVFIGSDTLRLHNADILLSQNVLTLFGQDRNKLSVPFVRPEDEAVFRVLCTVSVAPHAGSATATAAAASGIASVVAAGAVAAGAEKAELKATAMPFTPSEQRPKSKAADSGNINNNSGNYNDDAAANTASSLSSNAGDSSGVAERDATPANAAQTAHSQGITSTHEDAPPQPHRNLLNGASHANNNSSSSSGGGPGAESSSSIDQPSQAQSQPPPHSSSHATVAASSRSSSTARAPAASERCGSSSTTTGGASGGGGIWGSWRQTALPAANGGSGLGSGHGSGTGSGNGSDHGRGDAPTSTAAATTLGASEAFYQKPGSGGGRAGGGGRGMKVLKPSSSSSASNPNSAAGASTANNSSSNNSNGSKALGGGTSQHQPSSTTTSRSSNSARTGAAYEPAPSRGLGGGFGGFGGVGNGLGGGGEGRSKGQQSAGGFAAAAAADGLPVPQLRWESRRAGAGPATSAPSEDRMFSSSSSAAAAASAASGAREGRGGSGTPRTSNPVGSASAFAWMNAAGGGGGGGGKQKASTSATAE